MFEWDEAKRRANLASRGIDFADAVLLDWRSAMVVPDARRDYGEPRFLTYAMIEGRLHVMAFTPRAGKLRIISLRHANRRETRKWESR